MPGSAKLSIYSIGQWFHSALVSILLCLIVQSVHQDSCPKSLYLQVCKKEIFTNLPSTQREDTVQPLQKNNWPINITIPSPAAS